MVALKSSDFDSFLVRGKQPIVLIFGPDAGLVRERAQAVVTRAVEDLNDPFSLARLDGDALAETPERLVEEAHTIPLFGGRRAVLVRAGTRNFSAAVEKLINAPPGADCRVVIEAGDLTRSAPLRSLCEKAAVVASFACYPDAERDLSRLIDQELRDAGLAVTADARALLVASLGGDRLASRSELQKLTLYSHGSDRVDVDDVTAIITDASAPAFDVIADAVFAGQSQEVDRQFAKARSEGTPATVIVGAALRLAAQLHRTRLDIEGGVPIADALRSMRVHFRREKLVETALRNWTAARLERAIAHLAEATFETRLRADLGDSVASRALLATSMRARGRD
jgi:DNA polymerase III subunit delta